MLVTGHTGFKGSWLSLWLSALGARVTGISLSPTSKPNLFTSAKVEEQIAESHICDVRDEERLGTLVREANADIVFHLAAQALVLESPGHSDLSILITVLVAQPRQ